MGVRSGISSYRDGAYPVLVVGGATRGGHCNTNVEIFTKSKKSVQLKLHERERKRGVKKAQNGFEG